eukprot:gene26657-33271_t
MTTDPSSIVISFSVPWSTRQSGYPLHFNHNASRFDPWSGLHSDGISTAGGTTGVVKKLISVLSSVTHICVAGLRPLNPYRADVGIVMLLEFIQHHLLLGVKHIFLGLQVDCSTSTTTSTPPREVQCSFKLKCYGVSDPLDVFASWGPGDDAWTEDYFRKSPPSPLHPDNKHSVSVLITRRVVAVDVTRGTGRTIALCSGSTLKTNSGALLRVVVVVVVLKSHFEA